VVPGGGFWIWRLCLPSHSWLRGEAVRGLLAHSTLLTTLVYSGLVLAGVQRAHRKAAAIERMNLGEERVRGASGAREIKA